MQNLAKDIIQNVGPNPEQMIQLQEIWKLSHLAFKPNHDIGFSMEKYNTRLKIFSNETGKNLETNHIIQYYSYGLLWL